MQLSFDLTQNFEFSYHLLDEERLPLTVGLVSFLVEKPLDFDDTTFSVPPSL